MKGNIRVGLVGLGKMGTIYAERLALSIAESDLAAVVDVREDVAQGFAKRFNVPYTYIDPEKLLQKDDIDAVVITTPTSTHKDLIIAAAQANKHIFCEKPIALTLEDTDAALQAVKQAGVKLQVGFMRRCDAGYAAAKKKISNGVIGKPVMFKSIGRDPMCPRLDFARPEVSGGLIIDMAVHDFDLARWLMGSEVKRVYAEGGTLVFPELNTVGDIDNAVINLLFENGTLGNIDVSRNALYGYDIRTEVLGSKGGLQIGYFQQTPLLVLTKEHGANYDVVPYIAERFGPAYAEQIRLFIACIREGTPPLADGNDARRSLEIGIAATRSYHEQRPVELPLE